MEELSALIQGFGVILTPAEAATNDARGAAIADAAQEVG